MVENVNLTEYILDRVYGKGDSYTREEINETIRNAISELQFLQVVPSLDSILEIKSNKIYMVPNNTGDGNNVYDLYIFIGGKWEKIDSFDFDADSFAKKEDIPNITSDIEEGNYNAISSDAVSTVVNNLTELSNNLTNLYNNLTSFNEALIEFDEGNTNLSNDLTKLRENLLGFINRVNGLINDLDSLSGSVDRLDATTNVLRTDLDATSEDLTTVQSGLSSLNTTVEGLDTDLKDTQSELENLQSDLTGENGLSDSLSTLRNELDETKSVLGTTRETIGNVQNDITDLQSDDAQLTSQINSLNTQLNGDGTPENKGLVNSLKDTQDDLADLNDELDDTKIILNTTKDLAESTQSNVDTLQAKDTDLTNQLNTLKTQLNGDDTVTPPVKGLSSTLNEASESLSELTTDFNDLKEEFTETKNVLTETNTNLSDTKNLSITLRNQLIGNPDVEGDTGLSGKVEELEDNLDELNDSTTGLSNRLSDTENSLSITENGLKQVHDELLGVDGQGGLKKDLYDLDDNVTDLGSDISDLQTADANLRTDLNGLSVELIGDETDPNNTGGLKGEVNDINTLLNGDEANEEDKGLRGQLTNLQSQTTAMNVNLDKLWTGLSDGNGELMVTGEQIIIFSQELDEFLADLTTLGDNLTNFEGSLTEFKEQNKDIDLKTFGLDSRIVDLFASIGSVRADVSTLDNTINDEENGLVTHISNVQNTIYGDKDNPQDNGLIGTISDVQGDITNINSTIGDENEGTGIYGTIQAVDSRVDTTNSKINTITNNEGTGVLDKAVDDIEIVDGKISAVDEDISGVREDISSVENRVDTINTTLGDGTTDGVIKDLNTAKSDIQDTKSDIVNVQGDISATKSTIYGDSNGDDAHYTSNSLKGNLETVSDTVGDSGKGLVKQLNTAEGKIAEAERQIDENNSEIIRVEGKIDNTQSLLDDSITDIVAVSNLLHGGLKEEIIPSTSFTEFVVDTTSIRGELLLKILASSNNNYRVKNISYTINDSYTGTEEIITNFDYTNGLTGWTVSVEDTDKINVSNKVLSLNNSDANEEISVSQLVDFTHINNITFSIRCTKTTEESLINILIGTEGVLNDLVSFNENLTEFNTQLIDLNTGLDNAVNEIETIDSKVDDTKGQLDESLKYINNVQRIVYGDNTYYYTCNEQEWSDIKIDTSKIDEASYLKFIVYPVNQILIKNINVANGDFSNDLTGWTVTDADNITVETINNSKVCRLNSDSQIMVLIHENIDFSNMDELTFSIKADDQNPLSDIINGIFVYIGDEEENTGLLDTLNNFSNDLTGFRRDLTDLDTNLEQTNTRIGVAESNIEDVEDKIDIVNQDITDANVRIDKSLNDIKDYQNIVYGTGATVISCTNEWVEHKLNLSDFHETGNETIYIKFMVYPVNSIQIKDIKIDNTVYNPEWVISDSSQYTLFNNVISLNSDNGERPVVISSEYPLSENDNEFIFSVKGDSIVVVYVGLEDITGLYGTIDTVVSVDIPKVKSDINDVNEVIGDEHTPNTIKGDIKNVRDDVDDVTTIVGDESEGTGIFANINTVQEDVDTVKNNIGNVNNLNGTIIENISETQTNITTANNKINNINDVTIPAVNSNINKTKQDIGDVKKDDGGNLQNQVATLLALFNNLVNCVVVNTEEDKDKINLAYTQYCYVKSNGKFYKYIPGYSRYEVHYYDEMDNEVTPTSGTEILISEGDTVEYKERPELGESKLWKA